MIQENKNERNKLYFYESRMDTQVADTITFGIYACSPTTGSYKATFTDMVVTECQWESDADWKQKQITTGTQDHPCA